MIYFALFAPAYTIFYSAALAADLADVMNLIVLAPISTSILAHSGLAKKSDKVLRTVLYVAAGIPVPFAVAVCPEYQGPLRQQRVQRCHL